MIDRPRATRPRHRTRSRHAAVAGVAAAGLLLAACGGGGDGSGVASVGDQDAAAAADTSTEATEEEMLDYTECLRDQGLPVADPQVDANGDVSFGGIRAQAGSGEGNLRDIRESFEAAQEVCGEPPGGGFEEPSAAEQAEMEDAVLEFAQCMRDNGVDFPDPEVNDGRVMMGGPDGPTIDANHPDFQAAQAECEDIMSGFQRGPGARAGRG